MPNGTHSFNDKAFTALSVLIDFEHSIVERGKDQQIVTLTLQNTGAGHHFPTGSPFKEVLVEMRAEYLYRGKQWKRFSTPFNTTLSREIENVQPWKTVSDSRIKAGETRKWTWPIMLPVTASSGPWRISVVLTEQTRGSTDTPIVIYQNAFPMIVR